MSEERKPQYLMLNTNRARLMTVIINTPNASKVTLRGRLLDLATVAACDSDGSLGDCKLSIDDQYNLF